MSREYIDNSRPQQQTMASLVTGYEPCSPKPGPITSSSAVKPLVNSGPQHENGDKEQPKMITRDQAECNEEQSMVNSQNLSVRSFSQKAQVWHWHEGHIACEQWKLFFQALPSLHQLQLQ